VSRSFIAIGELSSPQLWSISELAVAPIRGTELTGEHVALLFELPSLRTRAASIAAVQELGGWWSTFTADEYGIDVRESAEDVARTLAATCSIIAARVLDHGVFARMAAATDGAVGFVNLLSNEEHPTQALADLLVLAEHFGDGDPASLAGRSVAYVGDANNVSRSLADVLVRFGVRVCIGAPPSRQLPHDEVVTLNGRAEHGGSVHQFASAEEAVKGADAIYTDVWLSMGDGDDAAARRALLTPFQLNERLLNLAAPDAVTMHCLPAHRGEEITDAVLDSPRCLAWRQVRHRTTAIIGILRWIKQHP
jgi:ornithine carbamoyltransferase